MSMHDAKNSLGSIRLVSFWQIHKNPILLRYMRSRLRWNGLAAALILTLVITVFAFVISYNSAIRFSLDGSVNAYRTAFLPMFLIQVVLMMFIGTGAVASGITQEYEDGMVEYHRLTPMSPMAKIVGYLFGLPIREWFLFLVTSVFIGIIVVRGEVPMISIWKVYSVFFLSIILYHLIALVVVHSMKKKRVAGRVIQLLVIVLYFIFPLLSQFGLVFFEYLTVRPILKESMLEYIPNELGMKRILALDGNASSVPFFDQQLKAWNFSVIIMTSLTICFLVMLSRRWKDETSHLMSKPFGLAFFGFLMFFLIGNTLPVAKKGEMSITGSIVELREQALMDRVSRLKPNDIRVPQRQAILENFRKKDRTWAKYVDAPIAQSIFGIICILFACVVIYIVTPVNEKYLLGLRRAKNLKKKWIPFHWDEASGFQVAMSILVILILTLYYFSTTLYQASTMPSEIRSLITFIPIVCLYAALVVFTFYLVYEAWENKGLFMLILFIWVLPIMVMLVVAVQSSHATTLIWVSSISPLTAYGFGMTFWPGEPVRGAFLCSFVIQLTIASCAAYFLVKKKSSGSKKMLDNVIDY